jgi:hydroxymethylglutaryl-CoA lyase
MNILRRRGCGSVCYWTTPKPRQTSLTITHDTTAITAASFSTRKYDVRIVEVGPRDGLQNESSMIVPVDDKVHLIQLLMTAGCRHIEVGSFVSTKAVPNMANSPQVLQRLSELSFIQPNNNENDIHTKNTRFSALVPTLRYLQDALQYRNTIDEIAIFASASETFSQKVGTKE